MEELATTDALEREILEDARRKAEKTRKDGEAELSRYLAEAQARLAADLEELERGYAGKEARIRAEYAARRPLEEARIRASLVDAALRRGVEARLAALEPRAADALVAALAARAAGLVAGKALAIRQKGLGEARTKAILAAALPGATIASLVQDEALPGPGLVGEATDSGLRFRATLDLVAAALLEERRGELAAALEGRP